MVATDLKTHWNKAYNRTATENLGWHETSCEPSMDLIKKCNLEKNASILNAGSGTTLLIDELIALGYDHLIATDISKNALNKAKERLKDQAKNVQFIEDDLIHATTLNQLEPVDLWVDRAVLHFFTEKKEREAYFNLLKKLVKHNGYVIMAAFNLQGALKCSGLPVYRYNADMLKDQLGDGFQLLESFDHTFTMPSGDTREYVYALFRKK